MDPPRVSVVLPTFNRAATLSSAVESVLRQSMTDFELIVVDDGSTDDTLAVLNRIDDPRLHVVSSKGRSGANAARNQGVAMAQASQIAFQDSDDIWFPDKLTRQLSAAERTNAAVVWSPVLTQNADPRAIDLPDATTLEVTSDVEMARALCWGNWVSLQATLVSREALVDVGGLDTTLPRFQDWDLWLRLAERGCSFACDPEPCVYLRLSDDGITMQRPAYSPALEALLHRHAAQFRSVPRAELKQRVRLIRHHLRNLRPNRAIQQVVPVAGALRALCGR